MHSRRGRSVDIVRRNQGVAGDGAGRRQAVQIAWRRLCEPGKRLLGRVAVSSHKKRHPQKGIETYPSTWEFDDLAWYYGAAPSGLVVNENVAEFTLTGGATSGATPSIAFTEPLEDGLFDVDNRVGAPAARVRARRRRRSRWRSDDDDGRQRRAASLSAV